MKQTIIIAIILLGSILVSAQKFITKTGHIRFFSEASIEKIEAHNRQVNAAFDATTGDFVFKVLMKSFEFEKALMQEHFNENYVASDKFPTAKFLGKITNITEVNVEKDGIYPVTVEGKLTIHGITNALNEKGTLEVKKDKIEGKANFTILLADYKIDIPGAVVKNISKTIEITVDLLLEKASK
ncbi:MAG: YceI family protein [Bacteroidota bacterium]